MDSNGNIFGRCPEEIGMDIDGTEVPTTVTPQDTHVLPATPELTVIATDAVPSDTLAEILDFCGD